MKTTLKSTVLLVALLFGGFSQLAIAATPTTVDGVTTIHLDEYNGYFAADETLASLKPGKYEFVITNKAE